MLSGVKCLIYIWAKAVMRLDMELWCSVLPMFDWELIRNGDGTFLLSTHKSPVQASRNNGRLVSLQIVRGLRNELRRFWTCRRRLLQEATPTTISKSAATPACYWGTQSARPPVRMIQHLHASLMLTARRVYPCRPRRLCGSLCQLVASTGPQLCPASATTPEDQRAATRFRQQAGG